MRKIIAILQIWLVIAVIEKIDIDDDRTHMIERMII